MPGSVISRPIAGDTPTIDLVIGYDKANTSPTLKLFLCMDGRADRSRLEKSGDQVDEGGGNAP